ncbi:glycerol-3-phosphate dehydrogenase [Nadsonia fulvescens var. elongata DSM 6958]|uniref:Glycerol-3-phosphate dehydrogenase [NAD(+)] n=1 Tax=Nadsonia fulvescens var. elongata DSM 6958 TaxID=857566 RepID=A0A1E3PQ95_9ASCO|nr:glycerol-3-phosphate dehydrogenase [Nadsonia fulvescens var. elongata DSM 6958]
MSTINKKFRIAVLGSGSWGTTIGKVVAENTAEKSDLFEPIVKMWAREETLCDNINEEHENNKYLSHIKLPENLVAVSNILETVAGADLIIFNFPHQFLATICADLAGHIPAGTRAVSCLKGLNVDENGCQLLTDFIYEKLGVSCGALSGANLAPEVAIENWSGTTIAYKLPDDFRGHGQDIDADVLHKLFARSYFEVSVVDDVAGVSLAGALKNIVALPVGFVDGMKWGNNARAAIMVKGQLEIIKFGRTFFPECAVKTFSNESAGLADLIATCSGGRNARIGKMMAETKKSAKECERDYLNGQSAQGIHTTDEVYRFLEAKNAIDDFPLFAATYNIIYQGEDMKKIPELLKQ